MKKKGKLIALCTAAVLLLTGCLFRSPGDLYKLPEVPAGYAQLESAIRGVKQRLELGNGVSTEVCVILAGDNTATIQLQDLDGDGERESAITFIRVPGVEKPIKIYIFRQFGERFQVTGLIEGAGSAIYSIDYVELNGEGSKELVVNWQLSTGVYQLGAYTLDELDPIESFKEGKSDRNESLPGAIPPLPEKDRILATELLLTGASTASDGATISSGYQLLDLDQDNRVEIALAKMDNRGLGSQISVYGWHEGAFTCVDSVELSKGMSTLNRIRSNYLKGDTGCPALYVTGSRSDGSRLIDVVAYRQGKLTNLSMDPKTGASREQLMGYTDINPTDVDGDGVVEIPDPAPLPGSGGGNASNFWLIDWERYDELGRREHVLTTYHNVADSWYLEVPSAWKDQITISRRDQTSGQREVVFSLWNGENKEPEPFLSIYRLTGSNRLIQSTADGRFVLREEESVIYAAKLHECSWDCGMSPDNLLQSFNTIQNSWYYD